MALSELPPVRRLAIGLFLLSMVHFYAHAQWNLWVNVGRSALPTAEDVLRKYHGNRETTRLEQVLDPALDPRSDLAMYQYLDGDYEGPEMQRARYDRITAWVRRGAPEPEWPEVAPIFTHPKLCASCHAPNQEMEKAPLVTYAGVQRFARMDTGVSGPRLARLSHSHLAGFALLALAVSIPFSFTRYRRTLAVPLVVAAFLGPVIDVSGWWLTRTHGMPWPYAIMAGGALFGVSLMAMVVLTLDQLWLRGFASRALDALTGGRVLRQERPPHAKSRAN